MKIRHNGSCLSIFFTNDLLSRSTLQTARDSFGPNRPGSFVSKRREFKDPDDIYPTIYRIDRLESMQILDGHFHVPYSGRFEEGEFLTDHFLVAL